jgi:hypothetical protein
MIECNLLYSPFLNLALWQAPASSETQHFAQWDILKNIWFYEMKFRVMKSQMSWNVTVA